MSTNPFLNSGVAKPSGLVNNTNPFNTNSSSVSSNNQTNQSNPITNYFHQTTNNQVSNKPITPSPFMVNQMPNTNSDVFAKANSYKPNSVQMSNGLNSNNPFVLGNNTNNNYNGANPYLNQGTMSNQINQFQSSTNYSGNNTTVNNTNNQNNTNPFLVKNNTTTIGGIGQRNNNPFSTSNQSNTNGPFTNNSNNTPFNNNPFSSCGNPNTFINNTNSNTNANTNQYPFNNNSNTTTNNAFNTNTNQTTNTIQNNTTSTNTNNPFSINTAQNNNVPFNSFSINNNPSPLQPNTNININNNTNPPIGFTPSFNSNQSSCLQSQNTSNNPFAQNQPNITNTTNSNPFNIQSTSNQPTNNAPFYSTYPTNTPFPLSQQQHNTYYPNYSQLPYDLQYAPIFINQNYNYNQSINQTIEEIESKYLAQYLNDSIINKEREQEKKKQEQNDINSIIINHYEENQNKLYYLPSFYYNNNKENEYDPTTVGYSKLPQFQPKKKKQPYISTQKKIILKSNSQLSSVKPFRLSSNIQSTNKKQYSISNMSQSSFSSVSPSINYDSNYQYEVTIQFETPIRLTKVIKTRRYLNKDQLIKDIIERFKERRMIITSKDFILLLNGVVIGSEPKQVDLSKEAFSFSEIDSNIKKISIAGYFYQNKTEDIIIEEDPQNDMNQEDSFGEIKDDFYPITKTFITTPSIEELSSMNKTQLENVPNFSIANQHAKLFFDHPCDLTYVNLDHIKMENYLLINIPNNNIFIDKLRMKCTAEFYNILLDDTSFYQMNEVKRLCECNLKSDQFHYEKELEKLIVIVDLTKL